MGAGTPATLGEAMTLVYGKTSEKNDSPFLKTLLSLGNGRRLGFWKDSWCGETVLCNAFPTLFNLAAHKDARVADVWDSSREEGVPNLLKTF